MLYNLLAPLAGDVPGANLFTYLTFRTGGAIMTALALSFLIGPPIIRWLKARQENGQPIRTEYLPGHIAKAATPTMGGAMILGSVTLATLLWADIGSAFVWIAVAVMVGYGAIGALDDYLKLTSRGTRGLPGWWKIAGQVAIGAAATLGIMAALPPDLATGVALPVFKDVLIPLGGAFVLWALFVMVGASNAVNLTDGLDGLAIVPVAIARRVLASSPTSRAARTTPPIWASPTSRGWGSCPSCAARSSAGPWGFCGTTPRPLMGDTGSLAMGGVLAAVAVMTKHEIALAIIGGLFVLEALSVIVQVASFKLTGRRVFAMAPLHHHFEKKGWSEATIVIRFWIIAVVLAIVGLATLKLR